MEDKQRARGRDKRPGKRECLRGIGQRQVGHELRDQPRHELLVPVVRRRTGARDAGAPRAGTQSSLPRTRCPRPEARGRAAEAPPLRGLPPRPRRPRSARAASTSTAPPAGRRGTGCRAHRGCRRRILTSGVSGRLSSPAECPLRGSSAKALPCVPAWNTDAEDEDSGEPGTPRAEEHLADQRSEVALESLEQPLSVRGSCSDPGTSTLPRRARHRAMRHSGSPAASPIAISLRAASEPPVPRCSRNHRSTAQPAGGIIFFHHIRNVGWVDAH